MNTNDKQLSREAIEAANKLALDTSCGSLIYEQYKEEATRIIDATLAPLRKENTLLTELVGKIPHKHSCKDCRECDGTGVVDSGGINPWGSAISIPCPSCSLNAKDCLACERDRLLNKIV